MTNIQITADSASDLPQELIEKHSIAINPTYLCYGDTVVPDTEVSRDVIFDYYKKTHVLAKSSAANVEDYRQLFSRFTAQGKEVIHLGMSSGISCSVQNAQIAAAEMEGVYVIDSQQLSSGLGLLVLAAAAAAQSMGGAKAAEYLNGYKNKISSSFVLDSLEYLYKGGRCSSLALMGSNVLHLKPCIEMNDGSMSVGKKYRGTLAKCLEHYIDDKLEDIESIDPECVFITHTLHDKRIAESLRQRVEARNYFNEIHVVEAGGIISCHCGPGTLGILFVNK